jgi:hypothetical protein
VRPADAFAEDLRRLGLIFIASGVVGGFLQGDFPGYTAVFVVLYGVAACVLGYRVHKRQSARES